MKVSNKLLTMINLITQIFIWQNLRVLQRNNIAELLFCTNFHRSGHKIPSCGLHRSFDKWRNQDTLPNQSSWNTNTQSGTSTESPVAVPIDHRVWSSIEERKYV